MSRQTHRWDRTFGPASARASGRSVGPDPRMAHVYLSTARPLFQWWRWCCSLRRILSGLIGWTRSVEWLWQPSETRRWTRSTVTQQVIAQQRTFSTDWSVAHCCQYTVQLTNGVNRHEHKSIQQRNTIIIHRVQEKSKPKCFVTSSTTIKLARFW